MARTCYLSKDCKPMQHYVRLPTCSACAQKRVEEMVADGKNVFFTGNAGTGKSFLLNRIVDSLRQQYGGEFASAVAVTAATGIAATHVGGVCCKKLDHSCFIGFGLIQHSIRQVEGSLNPGKVLVFRFWKFGSLLSRFLGQVFKRGCQYYWG